MSTLKTKINNLLFLYKNSQLIKVSSKNATQVIVRLLMGLLNIKITSLLVGASGMALLSQFYNVIQFSTNIANGGIMHGVTKLTAQFEHSYNKRKLVVHNALLITLVFTLIPSCTLLLFSEKIAISFLYDIKYSGVLRASGILIFSMALNNLLLAYTNGIQDYKRYIHLNIAASIISTIITLPAIYFYGVNGGLWAQYIAALTITLITIIKIHDYLPSIHKLIFSKTISTRLIKFGLMLLVASSTTPLVSISIRNVIVENCSLDQAGWWDGINKISSTYISLIISMLSLYFLPKISKTMSTKELNSEIKQSLLVTIPFVALGSFLIYFFRDLIISLLFTEQFRNMRYLFIFQCIGDVVRIFNWFFAITVMMREQTKEYIIVELTMALIIIGSAYLVIPKMGIIGSTVIYTINTFIYSIFVITIYKRMIRKSRKT
ncbi:O-antigen translocase [Saccharicrinis sp. 156]|uniref:O-antigen translocase n=1 Tax=Saccharicrinis sp. 156 TaxID=3417574 RepID=UPI003D32A0B4